MNQRAMYVVLSVLLCLDLAPKVALAEDPSDVASPPASTPDSVPVDPLVAEMNEAMSDNDLMRVLAVANQILAQDPENIEALHGRSYALAEAKGDYAGAVADLERVTQLAPDAADAWGNMGWWLILDGRFDEAEKALRTAHGMAPDIYAHTVNLGHTFSLAPKLCLGPGLGKLCFPGAAGSPNSGDRVTRSRASRTAFSSRAWEREEVRRAGRPAESRPRALVD